MESVLFNHRSGCPFLISVQPVEVSAGSSSVPMRYKITSMPNRIKARLTASFISGDILLLLMIRFDPTGVQASRLCSSRCVNPSILYAFDERIFRVYSFLNTCSVLIATQMSTDTSESIVPTSVLIFGSIAISPGGRDEQSKQPLQRRIHITT